MHKLNFCGSLCLPQKVEGESRGMNTVMSFKEGVVIPFSGAATSLHALYTSRPFIPETGQILQADDLNDSIKVQLAISQGAVAADMALDTDPVFSIVSANRDANLRSIVDRLFSKGYERVALWSNNGLGLPGSEFSIQRNERNVAYGVFGNGQTWTNFDVASKPNGLYSSVAHDHVQFAPDTTGFSTQVLKSLDDSHGHIIHDSFDGLIARIRESPELAQGITYSVVTRDTDLSNPLLHSYYPLCQTSIPESDRQKFVRKQTVAFSKSVGLDYENKDFVKAEIAKAAQFYKLL